MTDAISRPRTVRALAVAGALGLALSPAFGATAFAAPGTVKIVAPGTSDEVNENQPHQGCTFDVRLEGAAPGSYQITLVGQPPTPFIPEVTGVAVVEVPEGETSVSSTYTLRETENAEPAAQGFHLKVNAKSTDAEDTVSSKVIWVDCDFQAENGAPGDGENGQPGDAENGDAGENGQPGTGDEDGRPRDDDRHDDADRGRPEARPTATASVPSTVASGLDGGNGGLVALGLGGVAVAGLAAAGVRRRTRR